MKRIGLLLVPAMLLCAILCALSAQLPPAGYAETKRTPPRLVSLAPSNTELIYSLGAEGMLVGVSSVCDYPAAAKQKPKAGSFVNVKLETITRLEPDYVLLVSGQEQVAASLKNRKFKVLVMPNRHLSDITANLKTIGEITGKQRRAAELSDKFRNALQEFSQIISSAKEKPRLFVCVWPEPLITAGAESFMHEAVTACGAENVAGSIKSAFPRINIERVIAGKPDILILAHEAVQQSFWKKPPWNRTPAATHKRVFFLPEADKDPLARPTLRILDGLGWLSGITHPELEKRVADWKRKFGIKTDVELKRAN